MHCQKCHVCGTQLRIVLDGEEWCSKCQAYRRYESHGWKGQRRPTAGKAQGGYTRKANGFHLRCSLNNQKRK
jgi:hypothetical protein